MLRNRRPQIEGGIHALGKGNPLPPPQHGKSQEAGRGHTNGAAARNAGGVQPAAATATAPASARTSPSFDGGSAREAGGGGRGTDGGSRRNGAASGAAGNVSTQVCKRSRTAIAQQDVPFFFPLLQPLVCCQRVLGVDFQNYAILLLLLFLLHTPA